MKRYLFVALALVVFLIVPVSAWIPWTVYNVSTTATSTYVLTSVILNNQTEGGYTNITKVHWDPESVLRDTSRTYSASASGEYTADLCVIGDKKGDAIISWDIPTPNAYTAEGWIEIEFVWSADPGTTAVLRVPGTSCTEDIYTNDLRLVSQKKGELPPEPHEIVLYGTGSFAGGYISYSGSEVVAPTAAFTCTPTSQYPDEAVVCTDTSTGGDLDWYWTITAEALGTEGFSTGNSQNFTWYSHYPGLYSVNLKVNNSAGNDWENKTNYVSISENATPNNCNIPVVPGLIRSWAQCVDSQTSGAVAGCDLSLYDLEGGAWSNVTDRFDGTWCIDTYPAHHFNAYGSADGYTPDPTYRLNLNVNEHVVYELLMHPGYVPPAAEGKVWVYGIVNDADTGAAIEGAVFRLDASGQTSKSDTTDAAGSMHIQWVNKTQTTATASKAGYGTISKVFTTSDYGPDTVRIELHKSIVTPTATATTGPGGTVPTTVNPNGPNNGVYPADYTSTQGQAIMNLLAYHGYDLVLLCILVTMMALLGFKLGGR